MNQLYKPTKQDRISLSQGARKLKLNRLRADKRISAGICEFCKTEGYQHVNGDFLTTGGSKHTCNGMKKTEISV